MTDNAAMLTELFPDLPARGRRYLVEVALRRDAGEQSPAEDHRVLELAAVMLSARGLITGWQSRQSVLSLVMDATDDADAIESGAAVVRTLGGSRGATVKVEPVATPRGPVPRDE